MFNLIKFLLKFSPKIVITAIISGILSGVASAALIAVINSGINKPSEEKMTILLAFIGLGLVMLFSGIIAKMSLILLSQSAVFQLRLRLSEQIIKAPLKFLENYGGPRLLASLIDDVQIFAGTLLGIPALCINFATVVICLIYIGWLSLWVLGAVVLFTIIGVLSYYTFLTMAWNYLRRARETQNKLFADFRALTQGTKELKLSRERREAFLDEELEKTARTYRGFSTKGSQIYAGSDSWGQFLFIILIGLIIFGLPQIVPTESSVLTGYVLALLYIMAPLEVMINFFPNIGRAQIALQQIESLGLTLSEENRETTASAEIKRTPFRELTFEKTAYHYLSDHGEKGFQVGPLELTIRAGEAVFLVGGNGSGKTTMLKMLTGLYLPDEGTILLNGEKLDESNLDWYRSYFSAVFSDFYLFDKLLGLDHPLLDEVAGNYLKKLRLEDKVKIADGIFSTLDLSQGQRKRLALLTSFLEEKDFFVFDEWAADQDPIFKNIFYKELLPELKAKGKTLLVITHDDRYFSLADRVIKLDYGRLEEMNPHDFPPVEGIRTISELAAGIEAEGCLDLERVAVPDKLRAAPSSETFDDLLGADLVSSFFRDDLRHKDEPVPPKNNVTLTIVSAIILSFLAIAALTVVKTPSPVTVGLPPTEFSAENAQMHVQKIADKKRPVGTAENKTVRNYIIETLARNGLRAEILKAETIESIRGEIKGGTTQNIVVRIPGTEGKYRIALSGHYDSTPYSFGASDNAVAVGTLLETIRAVKAGEPLKNDLVFIFTDGEEETMLGARGLRDSTELYREIDLIFNFEARGTSGATIMFETSRNNGFLIENLAASGADVLATSVSADLYELMPNFTDFTIFKENNLNGLNFAFIGSGQNYHSTLDSLDNLSKESVSHQGNYAIKLARHFGNLENPAQQRRSRIYFSLPGFFASYSESLVWPLTLGGLILLAGLVIIGIRRGKLGVKGVLLGLTLFVAALVLSLIISLIVGFLTKFLYLTIGGQSDEAKYTAGYIVLGGVLLAVALHFVFYSALRQRIFWLNLTVGTLVGWWFLLLLASLFLPGGTYLFLMPLAGGLASCGILVFRKSDRLAEPLNFGLMLLFSIPALLVFVPLIYLLGQAFGENSLTGMMVLVSLLMTTIVAPGLIFSTTLRKAVPVIFALAAAGLLIAGIVPSRPGLETPGYHHLFYAANADTRKAVWTSADTKVNAFTGQFLGDQPEKGKINDIFPSNHPVFLYRAAQYLETPPPTLELLNETVTGDSRILRLRLRSARNAPTIYLFAAAENRIAKIQIKMASLNPGELPPQKDASVRKLLTYFAIPVEGLEITVETNKNTPLKLIATDQTYGLPVETGTDPSVKDFIFNDLIYNDSTLVSKTFEF